MNREHRVSEYSARQTRESSWTAPPVEMADDEKLQLLFENNERTLQLMAQLIESGSEDPGTPALAFDRRLRALWIAADVGTLARAACVPTLLLDIRGWETAPTPDAPRGFFPELCAVPLMRSTLMLAWHVCRTDRQTASIRLGLPAPSLNAMSRLSLHDLERIALTRAHCLRPRWLTRPSMWMGLLEAARANSLDAFEEFKLHALQQVIGELLSAQAER